MIEMSYFTKLLNIKRYYEIKMSTYKIIVCFQFPYLLQICLLIDFISVCSRGQLVGAADSRPMCRDFEAY